MEKLILENISCVYDNTIVSLDKINLSVSQGECICIAGANGSGKSTLLQIIAGCVKPSLGSIIIDGVRQKNDGKGRVSGIVFQDPEDQLFMPSVWEDVAFGVMEKGMDCETAKALAIEALESVDAAYLAERAPYKLSGGEKQRAALAAVLIMKPDILLLDEPTAALDPRARKNLIALLKKIPRTKIIATHDLDMALEVADRVIFLRNGRIAAASPVPGLLLDEVFLQDTGLELPPGAARFADTRRLRSI
ncbi:MAG: energy-coupling factor ABC transporter ATP-binding protein [Spirochaetaceae bacterium]|jgi:cobalt/nickel transport system ATP-binding protein|nr:energy-coupling factor ABC transporter ATP-binding protein [Spirochaetaceae bacterium]